MNVYKDPFPDIAASVAALGTFDGVHVGHRAVVAAAVNAARELGVPAVIYTFSDLPRNVFSRKKAPLLCTPAEKARLLAALGADVIVMPEPTRSLLALSPEEFLDRLTASLRPRRIVVGYNYTFGKGAAGNTDTLRKYADERGIPVTVVPPVTENGAPVSSSAIRRLLAHGDTAQASALLGRKINI